MDGRKIPLPEMGGEPAKELCDRRFGIGGDGLILALPPQQGGDVRMQILNADGTEAEMCGNGIRCFARFLADLDGSPSGTQWRVETPAGLIIPRLLEGDQVTVAWREPFLEPGRSPQICRQCPCIEGELWLASHCRWLPLAWVIPAVVQVATWRRQIWMLGPCPGTASSLPGAH